MEPGPGSRWMVALTVLLLGLLAVLAALQVGWIDAWSTSEAARVERFVSTGTERLAIDLERGLRELDEVVGVAAVALEGDVAGTLRARVQDVLGLGPAADSQLLRAVIWVDPGSGEPHWILGADEHPESGEWSAEFGQWQRAAEELDSIQPGERVRLPSSPPGLVLPLLPVAGAESGRLHLVLLLFDTARLGEQLVAPLVEQHLGEAFGDEVQVIVTHGGQVVFRSQPGLEKADFLEADAARPFGGGRLEIGGGPNGRQISLERGGDGGSVARLELEVLEVTASGEEHASPEAIPMSMLAPITVELPGWEVRAVHAAGSVEAAVAAVRSRNLALGLGVLGTLAGAALLLVLAARRTRILARRQVEFVAGVTHELRTPLTIILSAAENLRDCVVTEPDDMRRYGSLIHAEARRLTDFVERALSLAGTTPPPPGEHVELAPVIERSVARCRSESEDGPAVRLELPPALPFVRVDPNALEQALDNLLTNARKYGGDAPEVQVAVVSRPGWVDITVRDRGPGISAEERKHVFEPFFRGDDARASQVPGAGLGLAVVKRMIEAQGGSITLESEPGTGSAFTLHLRVTGA